MYIIMDLDDTLLNKKRELTNYTKNVLSLLQQKGHKIVINTARSLDATTPVINQFSFDYSIMNGGALITKGLDVIYKNQVDVKTTNEILKEIISNNTEEFSIECEFGLFSNKEEYANKNKYATYFDYKNEFPYGAYKILMCSIDGVLPNYLSKKYNLEITHYVNGPWYRLSVCTKHDGNIALYNLLNDTNPQSICFGDDIGDIEMLENATIGVALNNSVEKVLEKIKTITEYSSDEDGVAKYLEIYFDLK